MTLLMAVTVCGLWGSPAGGSHAACDLTEVGWFDDFRAVEHWRPEPWLVTRPDDPAADVRADNGGVFAIQIAGHEMLWTRTDNPVWMSEFPFLEVDYEADGLADSGGRLCILLGDDSTGPVTPGALNPENPQASGNRVEIGPLPSDRGHAVFDVREHGGIDRVARIGILLSCGQKPAAVRIRRLTLRSSDPRAPATSTSAPAAETRGRLWLPDKSDRLETRGRWQNITLPMTSGVPVEALARALGRMPNWPADPRVYSGGIPFLLNDAEAAAMATGIMQQRSLEVAGRWRGSELSLLLATRMVGRDGAWYGLRTGVDRQTIASPHRLLVHLDYDDGSRRSYFPWSVTRRVYVVDEGPEAYVVPLDPQKQLVGLAIEDKMSFGQVFLLAASVNTSPQASHAPQEPDVEPVSTARPVTPLSTPARWEQAGDLLTVENAWLRLTADLRNGLGLQTLDLVPFARSIVRTAEANPLVTVLDEQNRKQPLIWRDLKSSRRDNSAILELAWICGDSKQERALTIILEVENAGAIRLRPRLTNPGADSWSVSLTCPRLEDWRISSQAGDSSYLLGTRSAILGSDPIRIEKPYGARWPLQLIDLFADRAAGGLALMVEDPLPWTKTFQFEQDADGANLAVRYPYVVVPPGQAVELPTAVLLPHAGDWHEAFAAYTQSIRRNIGLFGTRMAQRYYCRRDYPLGGTDYLYDARSRRYTPERLIAETKRELGGLDLIDVSGWALSEKNGRVGDYLHNDLGGLGGLGDCVRAVRRQAGSLGLYFEGYLVDRRCPLADRALPGWQIIDHAGLGRWWPGGQMEFFVCPAVQAWRDELSATVARVAAETDADSVYLDEFGVGGQHGVCWSGDHGHPVPSNPLLAERQILQAVRRTLDELAPRTGIYIEYAPCDALAGYVDGAFDYGMNDADSSYHPTRLPLHRFVYPELALFEMVGHGIRPVPFEVDDLHRCLFHGMGIWIKGRTESWFTPAFRELARKAYPILMKHGEVFRSADCTPLIPTRRPGLYASRFATPNKILITLYNGQYHDLHGDLVEVDLPSGWTVQDLLTAKPAEVRGANASAVIRGCLQPHSAGLFLLSAPAGSDGDR